MLIPTPDKLIQLLMGRVQSIKTKLISPLQDCLIFFAAEAPLNGWRILGQVTGPVMAHEVDVCVEGELPGKPGQNRATFVTSQ
jgi:hypothetical protein